MDVAECMKKGFIRPCKIDKNLVASLMEMSNIKEKIVTAAVIDNETVNGFLPMAYDSLREILECIAILLGYKVISHECLGKLLIKEGISFDHFEFERFRYIRNSINYYGKKIEAPEGKQIIAKMMRMKKNLTPEVDMSEMSIRKLRA